MQNIDHWLKGKGKSYQTGKFSLQQIKNAPEMYLNEISNVSSSSKDSTSSFKAWRPVSKERSTKSQTEKKKLKVSDNPKL